MKTLFASILIFLTLISAGGGQAAAVPESSAAPLTEATPEPEPETVAGEIVYVRIGAVLSTLERGEQIEILDDLGELCYVRYGALEGFIEKMLIYPDAFEPYAEWDGYAKHKALLFSNCRLTGEAETLSQNTHIHVLSRYGDCLVVSVEDTIGYMLSSSVSEHYIQSWSGGGGGSSGGSSGGGGSADGGDISLTAARASSCCPSFLAVSDSRSELKLLSSESESEAEPEYSGTARTIVDGAELWLTVFEPGDEVRVAQCDELECTVYYERQFAAIPRCFVRLEGEEAYEPWTGYAKKAYIYKSHLLNDPEPERLSTNTKLTVTGELESCYVVEYNEEQFFVPKEQVSEDKIYEYSGYSGGGGGGSSGGDWTAPAL